ncbi:hypothetical protein ACWC2K_13320 [Streptomyces chattanoogensis]|uniref:hypothetical protein n=1 Tax=Streptomyces chattanoogensis TaxID=66876 RepID=UPI0036BA807D
MHMNSAPHLLNEDRAEFARLLDEALRTAGQRPDGLACAAGKHLGPEQLRTMALSATTAIAACATAEYQRYVQLRTDLRTPAAAPSGAGAGSATEDGAADEATGLATGTGEGEATPMDETTEAAGAGLAAMIAVLVPVLAGIAAVLFLLIGYVLRAVSPDKSMTQPLISVGWIFAALTAAGSLVAMTGLVITALRNGSTSSRATKAEELRMADLDRARDAWRQALLERGLLPFLREALNDPDPSPDPTPYIPSPASAPQHRMPTLGYTRPTFSSPDSGSAGSRPRYSSPDFTSPEYGGSGAGSASGGGTSE